MSLTDLFPDQDYQFQLRFERGEPARYFQPTAQHDALIAQRTHWLRTEPEAYSALLPECAPLLDEVIELAGTWNGLPRSQENASAHELLLALGEFWEPDFLLLRLDADQKVRLYGGCVCFPSSWRLSEKIGQPIEFIHGPVPGLNASIGVSIHKFLSQLKPGVAWQRTNWGLSASPEFNQHPDRRIAPLKGSVHLHEVWLRVEHQALIALPRTGGILFGIRIAVHPLAEVRSDPLAASRLRRALQTMPPDVARYKSIFDAKDRLIELLKE
jgi:hypothetical protein